MRTNLLTSKKLRVRRGYWDSIENQRQFIDSLYYSHNFQSFDDFYKISNKFVIDNGGSSLISKYSSSYIQLLSTVYPNYPWNFFDFNVVPVNFWEDPSNHRKYLENIASTLEIKKQSDWYKLKFSVLKENKGTILLKKYGNIVNALKHNFPEFSWEIGVPGKFAHQRGFWRSTENQRSFLDNFAEENNIKTINDWYNITNIDIYRAGGTGLLRIYSGSLFTVLQKVYPEKEWSILDSSAKKKHYWSLDNNLAKFLFTVQQQYDIQRPEDWCRISLSQIDKLSGRSLWKRGIRYALEIVHPDQDWDRIFSTKKKKKKKDRVRNTKIR